MADNEETQEMPEFDGHVADEKPTPEPATQEPIVTEPSLEEIAKAYNMTPAQVIKSYGEAQKKITQQGQEFSDFRKRYQWADQFEHTLREKPDLRKYIEDYPGFEQNNVPSEVKGAIDPVYQKVNQLETYILSMEMNSKIDAIGKQFPLDQQVRDAIFVEVEKTGNPDVEAHYWKLMGPKLVTDVADAGKREALSARNKDAYVPSRGTSTKSKSVDVGALPQNEWSSALQDEIEGMFRKTD